MHKVYSRTILVIDNDESFHDLMRIILERDGFQVKFASDGNQGVDEAQHCAPDLVILDLGMSGMDGLAVCRRIRAFSCVPILFVSGFADQQTIRQALECGNDYLTKPFTIQELRARIQALLRP